ncbi:hypothetical protein [Acinetobacter guillouiae]|uniref:hypothetical protein n=1 Tax=Acinetobacter guillouiae TaxID=106649 RepID=UPI003AF528D2
MDIKEEKKAIKNLKASYMEDWDLTEDQKDDLDALVYRVLMVGKEEGKQQATPEGFVLMPIKPTETMVIAVVKEHEGEAFLPYSLYDAFVKQAMIEAQEQSHD